jgi:hypothetical protein
MKEFEALILAPARQDKFDATIVFQRYRPPSGRTYSTHCGGTPFYLMWRIAQLKDDVITIRAAVRRFFESRPVS